MNCLNGTAKAHKVVFSGFVTGIFCSLLGSQIMLEAEGYEYPAVALRVAIASGLAFLVAQLADVFIFNRLRNGLWWRAPLASTIVGSILDTALFFTIAFSASLSFFSDAANQEISWAWELMPLLTVGNDAPLWVSLAVADWIVKLSVALMALVPFRIMAGASQ